MRGDWNRPQRWASEHHHDIGGGNAAALGHELGLARMLEADPVELLFGDRPRDNLLRPSQIGEPNGDLERIEGTMGSGDARMTRRIRVAGVELD